MRVCTGKRQLLMNHRKMKLMTQMQVAHELGMSQALYNRIENGYYVPEQGIVDKLIQKFRLPKDYFEEGGVYYDEQPN